MSKDVVEASKEGGFDEGYGEARLLGRWRRWLCRGQVTLWEKGKAGLRVRDDGEHVA